MDGFAWAIAAFVLLHVGVSATPVRAALIGRIGEGPYRGLFSLVSAALLLWMIHAFGVMRADPSDPLNELWWMPPPQLRWGAYVLVGAGFLLGFTGLFTPGPTFAGFEGVLSRPEPARGVLRITRHPFLWGVALWGFGHLLINGERFALMLFGALAFMAIYGTRSIDRKGRARNPEGWAKFEAVTSNAPFAAFVQGRNRLNFAEMGWRPFAAAAIFVLVGVFHKFLFGVSAFVAP